MQITEEQKELAWKRDSFGISHDKVVRVCVTSHVAVSQVAASLVAVSHVAVFHLTVSYVRNGHLGNGHLGKGYVGNGHGLDYIIRVRHGLLSGLCTWETAIWETATVSIMS